MKLALMKTMLILNLLMCTESTSVPGFDFGDNRNTKYITAENGVPKITIPVNNIFALLNSNFSHP